VDMSCFQGQTFGLQYFCFPAAKLALITFFFTTALNFYPQPYALFEFACFGSALAILFAVGFFEKPPSPIDNRIISATC